jgi:hypothetical protein
VGSNLSFVDQLSIQLYYFIQSPWSKIVLAVVFVVLIIWGIGATRHHAYHYAMKGARFGATGALLTALVMLGAFTYVFVDKTTLSDILSGKKPLTDFPKLATATMNRFEFVLGASSTATETNQPTAESVMAEIENLSFIDRERLQLSMCRQLIQSLNPNQYHGPSLPLESSGSASQ